MAKKSKSTFVMFENANEVFVTTPELEKKTLKQYFSIKNKRMFYEDEDRVPKKYRYRWGNDNGKDIALFTKKENRENCAFITNNLETS